MFDDEFHQYQEYIVDLVTKFKAQIDSYSSSNQKDKSKNYTIVRNTYIQIQSGIKEFNTNALTWPFDIRNKANEYTTDIKNEVDSIYNKFTHDVTEDSRKELLGQEGLAQIIKEEQVDFLLDGANDAKNMGMSLLDELSSQRRHMNDISLKISDLDTTLDKSQSFLNEMRCRDRQRKIFLIIVVIFLFLTCGVFIWYLIK